jgi:two-component system cell cycle sensor histidine kinase/response regulator CckA
MSESHDSTAVLTDALASDPAFFRHLCDSLGFACIAVDAPLQIVFWNSHADDQFGRPADQMLGRPILDVFRDEDRDAVRQLLESTVAHRTSGEMEVKLGEGAEQRTFVLIISPIMEASGRCIGASAAMRDISVRKRLSQELAKTRRMASLGKMGEGIAHYFNNILGSLQTAIDVALSNDSLREVRNILRQLSQPIAKAARITNQLAAFAEAENRQVEFAEINALVAGIVDHLRAGLKKPGVQIVAQIEPVPMAFVESQRVSSIIESLAQNAMEAMPAGGTLTVEMTSLDNHAVITVRDTGCGMTEEVQDHIFEPFFTTKADLGGDCPNENIGLGLAAVHGLVSEMGGTIAITSKVGQGTAVQIELPLHREPRDGESACDAPSA